MWASIYDFAELCRDGRWKVEFFSGELDVTVESAYPTEEIGKLVRESRDTIDPQEHPDTQFSYLGLENVESLTGDLVSFEPRLGSTIKSRSKVFGPGHVLYGRLRPYLNKVYLARGEVDEGICSGEFFVLVPDEDRIRPIVLRYLLASAFVVDHLARFQSGAALPRVSLRDLLQMHVPVPPMKDQTHLESALEEFEDHRRALRRKVQQMPGHCMETLTECLREGCPPQIHLPV